jgi:hypothetical protein
MFLVFKNEIADIRVLLLGCPKNSGTVAVCPTHNSKTSFPTVTNGGPIA